MEAILANYKVKAIILFGSYAKGTNHEDSDIDIAIITDDIKCNDVFDEQLNLKKSSGKLSDKLLFSAKYKIKKRNKNIKKCKRKYKNTIYKNLIKMYNRNVKKDYIKCI